MVVFDSGLGDCRHSMCPHYGHLLPCGVGEWRQRIPIVSLSHYAQFVYYRRRSLPTLDLSKYDLNNHLPLSRRSKAPTDADKAVIQEESGKTIHQYNRTNTHKQNPEEALEYNISAKDDTTFRIVTGFRLLDPISNRFVALNSVDRWSESIFLAFLVPEATNERRLGRQTMINVSPIIELFWSRHDRRVWLASPHMWYLLEEPSPQYRPIYDKMINQFLDSYEGSSIHLHVHPHDK